MVYDQDDNISLQALAEGGEAGATQVENLQLLQQPPPTNLVPVIDPQGEVVNISQDDLPRALNQGYMQASSQDVSKHLADQKYGSVSQQAVAGLEGAAQSLTFGASTGVEKAFGVKPEDIRGREEANPVTHGLGELGGLAIGSIYGTGEAAVLKGAGEAAAKAAGLGAKGTFLNQVGAHTVKSAVEATLAQGGSEVHKAYLENPDQSGETAIADMGLAFVLGGIFGGSLGFAYQGVKKITPTFISELTRPAVDAGDFRVSIETSNILKDAEKEGILAGLAREKKDAKEIRSAATRLNAPVMEGMTSDSALVQKAEDSLINGAPTYSGLRRKAMYEEGYQKAAQAIDESIGADGQFTKAELGNHFKQSISGQIEAQNAPIKAMYDAIKESHQVIPLEKGVVSKIADHISRIQEVSLSPSSPEGQLAKRVIREVENLRTVDDVKTYKSILGRSLSPTASSGEKRMAGILGDALTDLEEGSIERFAYNTMKEPEAQRRLISLIDQRKAANSQYKEFIGKVKTLSEQLGKGRVYGLQDALHFINEKLTPEEVTSRLFSKNNSEFLKFFAKEFPNETELMKTYQKTALREAASKTGTFSPKVFFNNLNKLEPEIQNSVFSKAELGKIRDAETYIRAFPKNFNPSGTSGMQAFRQFFEHPFAAASSNIRDLGIEKFLKLVSNAPEVQSAQELAKATVRGFNKVSRGVKMVLDPAKADVASNIVDISSKRNKLDKLVDDYRKNPEKLANLGDNNPVPAYATAFAAASARAVSYLSVLKPDETPKNPLDSKMVPSADKVAQYNRALDIAQNPLTVLKNVKDGSMNMRDVITLKAIYPSLYNQLSQQLQMQMINAVSDGKNIPYNTRIGMSTFLMQPMDSTFLPQNIQAAQAAQVGPGGDPSQSQQSPGPKRSTSALNKLPQGYQTPGQAREHRDLKP